MYSIQHSPVRWNIYLHGPRHCEIAETLPDWQACKDRCIELNKEVERGSGWYYGSDATDMDNELANLIYSSDHPLDLDALSKNVMLTTCMAHGIECGPESAIDLANELIEALDEGQTEGD